MQRYNILVLHWCARHFPYERWQPTFLRNKGDIR